MYMKIVQRKIPMSSVHFLSFKLLKLLLPADLKLDPLCRFVFSVTKLLLVLQFLSKNNHKQSMESYKVRARHDGSRYLKFSRH